MLEEMQTIIDEFDEEMVCSYLHDLADELEITGDVYTVSMKFDGFKKFLRGGDSNS